MASESKLCSATHTARAAVIAALWLLVWLSACGQIITRPTATPMPPTSVPALTPAATQRPTSTPAPYTPEPTATPTVTPTPVIYAIRSGDTLLGIANRFGVSVAAIQESNGILDPRSLRVGQELIIPTAGDDTEAGAEPTATSTPLPYTIENIFFAETPLGGLWCFGEVVNRAGQPLEGVNLAISLLDADNQVLSRKEGAPVADLVDTNDRAPFALLFASAPASFASYLAEPLTAIPAYLGSYYRDLEVRADEGSGANFGIYQVSGQVFNVGPEDAVEVTLVVTLYDAVGRVMGVRRAEPEHNVIPRGGHTEFDIDLVPASGPVVSYRIIPQARRNHP